VKDKDQEQFRSPDRQIVIFPASDKTGDLIHPYEKAQKS
jgi:branched-chain amino acid transport system substrate-binding protein